MFLSLSSTIATYTKKEVNENEEDRHAHNYFFLLSKYNKTIICSFKNNIRNDYEN